MVKKNDQYGIWSKKMAITGKTHSDQFFLVIRVCRYIYKIHVTVFIPKHSTILSASPGFVIVFCIFSMIRTETWKSWAENSALRTRTPELGTRQPYIHSARLSSRVSSSDIKASSSPAGLKASSARHRSRVKHRSCLHRPRTFQIHFSRSKVPSLMLPTWIILLPISSNFRSGTVVLKKNPWKLKLLIVTSFFKNGCYCSGSIKCGCTTFCWCVGEIWGNCDRSKDLEIHTTSQTSECYSVQSLFWLRDSPSRRVKESNGRRLKRCSPTGWETSVRLPSSRSTSRERARANENLEVLDTMDTIVPWINSRHSIQWLRCSSNCFWTSEHMPLAFSHDNWEKAEPHRSMRPTKNGMYHGPFDPLPAPLRWSQREYQKIRGLIRSHSRKKPSDVCLVPDAVSH